MKAKQVLLNTNSKKIHNLLYCDGRCKIQDMKEEFKVYFDTEEEALSYPSKGNPLGKLCTFCQRNKSRSKTATNS